MIQPSLIPYIQHHRSLGFNDNDIRTYLVQQGYPPIDVEDTFRVAQMPQTQRHEIHLSKNTLVGLGMVLLVILVLAGAGYFFISRGPSELLDLELQETTLEAEAGTTYRFLVNLINVGGKERYDVTLTHELLDITGKRVTSKTETVAISTRVSKTANLPIPVNLAAGSYVLRTTASYNGMSATSELTLTISAPLETATRSATPSGTPIPTLENPILKKSTANAPEQQWVEGGEAQQLNAMGRKQLLDYVTEIAKTDKNKAVSLCGVVEKVADQHSCYKTLTIQLHSSNICKLMIPVQYIDTCIITYAREAKDYSICGDIENEFLKESCIALGKIEDLKIEEAQQTAQQQQGG
ncbi:hypothetical protein HZB02_05775 [Candidatus Woesearchaeota archaeon]|nr:hypothetical protein [Candidatus Woesearchaeota archaeon]